MRLGSRRSFIAAFSPARPVPLCRCRTSSKTLPNRSVPILKPRPFAKCQAAGIALRLRLLLAGLTAESSQRLRSAIASFLSRSRAGPRPYAAPTAPGLATGPAIGRIQAAMQEHNLDWLAARSMLKPRSDAGRVMMNVPGGYGVLSIDMTPPGLIHREAIPLERGARLLLATDGFARLYEVFDAYSEATLLDAAFEKGLAALIKELRTLEDRDAACDKAPRLKPRDDATAVLAIAE